MNSNDLKGELQSLLNRASRENGSNTPDFILARFLMGCLESFEAATKARDEWYGIQPRPGLRIMDRL
jgi:hypothetical protein